MKVINLHKDENNLIKQAVQNNRQAQHALYQKYAPKMLSICRYYVSDGHFAEDVMITAFMKVFTNLKKFESKGNFEGWIRRIMVNECIDYIRVKKNVFKTNEIVNHEFQYDLTDEILSFSADDIQLMIDKLPDGCKTIFNLYAIEGYKHNEIAEMLKISEGTSKSQLAHARKLLQHQINQLNATENGTK
ncbi:RNA polymerase sigma factor [Flavobacterium sp.]|uniref:RNA polymerase sigma factor n=1 Tax=Flavobacterium sp. TaxID=239 RepID=UPI003528C3CA